jgi:hypothetical protein
MKEVNNDKRVLQVEIDNNVKKVDITGKDADDNVVMRQELSEDDLNLVTGGNLYAVPAGEQSVIGGLGGTKLTSLDGNSPIVATQHDLARMGLSADASSADTSLFSDPGKDYKISFGG